MLRDTGRDFRRKTGPKRGQPWPITRIVAHTSMAIQLAIEFKAQLDQFSVGLIESETAAIGNWLKKKVFPKRAMTIK